MGEVRNEWRPESAEIFISEIFYGRQAVFNEDSFSRIIWVGGVKTFPSKISSGAQSEDLGPSLTIQNKTNNGELPFSKLRYRLGVLLIYAVWAKEMEDQGGVSFPIFHTNQASTPADGRPLYVARVRTITVAGGFCINHCARELTGSRKFSLSLKATPTLAIRQAFLRNAKAFMYGGLVTNHSGRRPSSRRYSTNFTLDASI